MRIKWDYVNENVSQQAIQLEGITTKGIGKYGVAHVTIIGQVYGASTLEHNKN